MVVATVLVACASPVPRETAAQRQADSVRYTAQFAQWLIDSATVDSVKRTMDISELVTAYLMFAKASNPYGELSHLTCASERLGWDYGEIMRLAAVEMALDTVRKRMGPDALDYANHRMPRSGFFDEPIDRPECQGKRATMLLKIGQTSFEIKPGPPVKPLWWGGRNP